jgi:hypothetical protein
VQVRQHPPLIEVFSDGFANWLRFNLVK